MNRLNRRFSRAFRALAFAVALFTGSQLVNPPRAHAVAGVFSAALGSPSGGVVALAVVSGALGVVALGDEVRCLIKGSCGAAGQVARVVLGFSLVGLGYIFLDGQTGDLRFARVEPEQAPTLHVSAQDIASYNDELEELNAARETLIDSMNGARFETSEQLIDATNSQWERMGGHGVFSEGALRTARAVLAQAIAQAR
jgi:hypothetical protein